MVQVKYCALVPYSVEQMFHLVNNVNDYSEFIPGCSVSRILEQNNSNELVAEMKLTINGVTQSLITHNFFICNKYIIIILVHGPFKSFYGHWKFISMGSSISKIEYIASYEFSSVLMEKIFNYIFKEINNNIVDIFISRARLIYTTCL